MKKGIMSLILELALGACVIMLMGYWFDGVYYFIFRNFSIDY